jgi:hypothetical protein
MRGGVGLFEKFLVVPTHASFIFSDYTAFALEVGGGASFAFNNSPNSADPNEVDNMILPHLVIGARIDPLYSPVVFRLTLTPFLDYKKQDGTYFFLGKPDIPIVIWGGVSLGVSF